MYVHVFVYMHVRVTGANDRGNRLVRGVATRGWGTYLIWPSKYGEGEESRGEPCVQNVLICQGSGL